MRKSLIDEVVSQGDSSGAGWDSLVRLAGVVAVSRPLHVLAQCNRARSRGELVEGLFPALVRPVIRDAAVVRPVSGRIDRA